MIVGLHHAGFLVQDIAAARGTCGRMGFAVTPPTFPALPAGPRGALRAVGAGNAHIPFADSFVELVTLVGPDGPADDAVLIPLDVPDGQLERLAAGIAATTDRLGAALAAFPGLHILVFTTSDADSDAARLTGSGTEHRGVQRTRHSARGSAVPLAVVEIDEAPEGRLALAEPLPPGAHAAEQPEHPNGAVGLSDVLLCVRDADLADAGARYTRYLGGGCRVEGPDLVVDLPRGRLTIVPRSALDARLPGELPPALPCFVGCTVEVRDLPHAVDLLRRAGLPVRRTAEGLPFVPAAAALGAAVVFEPQHR